MSSLKQTTEIEFELVGKESTVLYMEFDAIPPNPELRPTINSGSAELWCVSRKLVAYVIIKVVRFFASMKCISVEPSRWENMRF